MKMIILNVSKLKVQQLSKFIHPKRFTNLVFLLTFDAEVKSRIHNQISKAEGLSAAETYYIVPSRDLFYSLQNSYEGFCIM
jgi:hypothetical protein